MRRFEGHTDPSQNSVSDSTSITAANAYYQLSLWQEARGIAPPRPPDTSAVELRAIADAFFQVQRPGIDGSAIAAAYVEDFADRMRMGQLAPTAWAMLTWRFPRTVAGRLWARLKALIKAVLRRGEVSPGSAVGAAMPGGAGTAVVRAEVGRTSSVEPEPAGAAGFVARCFDNWGDLDDALRFLTPGGRGVWGDVAFVRDDRQPADWAVFFNGPGDTVVRLRASPNRVIFAVGEPPTPTHWPMHLGQGHGTLVLTPDEHVVSRRSTVRRHQISPCMTRTWSVRRTYDELRATTVREKPKRLSWVTSNLALIAGHRLRLQFLERLRAGVEFDLFGRGFSPLADKWDGIAPYRYSIAFENTRAPYYFTEKLMDCFVAETMPIYYGSPRIAEFFPPESMVLLDPEDPHAVEHVREVVASDLWLRRRGAILEAKRLTLEKYNLFAQISQVIAGAADAPAAAEEMVICPVELDFRKA
jgi:hypothetical protein